MKQIQAYVEPSELPKIKKARGEKGFISNSAYVRDLIIRDLKKK